MRDHSRRLTAAAAAVIGLLTGSAFWLSYAHLHTVAAEHGLGGSEPRAWAWPGCLDLFIVAGELLMLRASLSRRTDWWAIALTVVGSGGSIALNIAGVGTHAQPLDYVVAAVPPTAALLAFGALMRQVHDALSDGAGQTALSTAETPAGDLVHIVNEVSDQAFPAIAETGTASDLQFSRIRENAPAAGQGRPLTGPVGDRPSLTEGHPVPLSVGSLGDLTSGEGTHRLSTPGAANGLHSAETPEVPSAVVTEFVTERPSTTMDAATKGVHTAHTPGDYRSGTPSDGVGLADFIDGPVYPEPVPAAYPAEHERVQLAFLPLPDRPRAVVAQTATVAAEPPRTRLQVDAEYVPEDGQDPGTGESEDDLTARARAEFADRIADGKVPPIREIRAVLAVGQDRAKRVQDVLRRDVESGVRA
ncbi:hypothetical protein GCM10010495_18070 [Kitasatospora herbaricolor]|uniref:DUF2637 domain-containing protein n=1 Tax=Kitasatospora herbaricolor TaxID=68217 RepID=UPI001748BA6C|nr:DUF2637 domain-containing protein [Kitasatospora herbaricolor]MDQ0308255.1 hypothetical protein [Kitasatospora herbaricolor]GGV06317.1 hypothetical protein GCM10010495_18070 [Kitasatospora herbaricolor]